MNKNEINKVIQKAKYHVNHFDILVGLKNDLKAQWNSENVESEMRKVLVRNIPKVINDVDGITTVGTCPTCDYQFIWRVYTIQFCEMCGQKIYWGFRRE